MNNKLYLIILLLCTHFNSKGQECSQDTIVPVAICDQTISIKISEDDFTLFAKDFDSGSYDNCGIEHFRISRHSDNLNNVPNDTFLVISSDEPSTQEITIWVIDSSGNFSSCQSLLRINLNCEINCEDSVVVFLQKEERIQLTNTHFNRPENCGYKIRVLHDSEHAYLLENEIDFTLIGQSLVYEFVDGDKSCWGKLNIQSATETLPKRAFTNDGIPLDSLITLGQNSIQISANTQAQDLENTLLSLGSEDQANLIYSPAWLLLDEINYNGNPISLFEKLDLSWTCDRASTLIKSNVTNLISQCGDGPLSRILEIQDTCNNKRTIQQQINLIQRSDFEVIFPKDTFLENTFDYAPESILKISDDENGFLGLSYNDQILMNEQLDTSIIFRTYFVVDWCAFNESIKTADVVIDTMAYNLGRPNSYYKLKDGGDGLLTYTQLIKTKTSLESAELLTCSPYSFNAYVGAEETVQINPIRQRLVSLSSSLDQLIFYKQFLNGNREVVQDSFELGRQDLNLEGIFVVAISDGKIDSCLIPVNVIIIEQITVRSYLDVDKNCAFTTADRIVGNGSVVYYQYGKHSEVFKKYIPELGMTSFTPTGIVPDVADNNQGLLDLWVDYGNAYLICTNRFVMNIDTVTSTNPFSFPLQYANDYTSLSVDINTPEFIPCEANKYDLKYSNFSTDEVTNITLQLIIHPNFSFSEIEPNLPIAKLSGDTITFNLDPLNLGEQRNHKVELMHSCSSYKEGTVQPVKAIIKSNDPRYVVPLIDYNGPNITVGANCKNDSIHFILTNKGTKEYLDVKFPKIIISDIGGFLIDPGLLDPQTSKNIYSKPANGKTYRMEANQVNGFPLRSIPNAVVEGCGQDEFGGYATGHYNDFTHDELEPFVSYSTLEPGLIPGMIELQTFPSGHESTNSVDPDIPIKMMIRFKNTVGMKIANIKFIDSLSDAYNVNSIQLGASSHKYSSSIDENAVLFFNVLDTVDPEESLFINFIIQQKPYLRPGTIIKNQVTAVLQDTMLIPSNNQDLLIDYTASGYSELVSTSKNPISSLHMFPNPARAFISLDFPKQTHAYISIQDISGKIILSEKITLGVNHINTSTLHPGIYIVKVESDQLDTWIGKLQIQY